MLSRTLLRKKSHKPIEKLIKIKGHTSILTQFLKPPKQDDKK